MTSLPTIPSPARVLIVDDVAANRDLLRQTLEPTGCEVLLALNGEMALRVAAKALPDVILLDLMMPGMDGFEVCRRLKADEATRAIPVLFITAQHELSSVLEGFQVGALDYIVKPFQPEEVRARVRTHLQLRQLTRVLAAKNAELTAVNEQLRAEMTLRQQTETALAETDERLSLLSEREAERWGIAGFVGRSPALARVLNDVRKLQPLTTSVLITGESGTGKELVARALHFGGPRSKGSFIAVNCAAIAKDLAESELFGHVKGAFSGATADKKGAFELANGGTLFLDEVGDMPVALQAKLLRTLENGAVWRVGGQTERVINVRVVAATNANLNQRMANGEFRQDLYFRLARFSLALPPLRDRREDIGTLASQLVQRLSTEMGRPAPQIHGRALSALEDYAWPGNVRELKNVLERALIECSGNQIREEHLALALPELASELPTVDASSGTHPTLALNVHQAMRELVERALAQTSGNISRAAQLLGVHRQWIYRVQAGTRTEK